MTAQLATRFRQRPRSGERAALLALLTSVLVALTAGGCGRTLSGCQVGTERCSCYGNLTCNPGLTCYSGLCVNAGAAGTQSWDGSAATGGGASSGDDAASVGPSATGGSSSPGGRFGVGGSATGGDGPADAAPGGAGGAPGTGGASGGTVGRGGTLGSGGRQGNGGSNGAGGHLLPAGGPCDIYAADGGPCVAAHSTIRRLSSSYRGPLYQVRVGGSKSGTGGTTAEIGFLDDGFADGAAQDTACGDEACTISIIYDQSGQGNHLTVAPAGGAKRTPDNEANAKALPVIIRDHKVYGVKITPGIGYRNNRATGTATGDDPETIYMVTSGNFYNPSCCFDYGNAEVNSMDNGEGAVEAVYFGNCTIWNKGADSGPWVMADLENGLWAGDTQLYAGNKSVPADWQYVTGMVKGDAVGTTYPTGHMSIKAGNAQTTNLETMYDGKRPNARYAPMRKEGAIILGIAGDNSNTAQGNFFEGLMTAHYSSDAADAAVQANISSTSAGYGN